MFVAAWGIYSYFSKKSDSNDDPVFQPMVEPIEPMVETRVEKTIRPIFTNAYTDTINKNATSLLTASMPNIKPEVTITATEARRLSKKNATSDQLSMIGETATDSIFDVEYSFKKIKDAIDVGATSCKVYPTTETVRRMITSNFTNCINDSVDMSSKVRLNKLVITKLEKNNYRVDVDINDGCILITW
jgi:hypothetical protein